MNQYLKIGLAFSGCLLVFCLFNLWKREEETSPIPILYSLEDELVKLTDEIQSRRDKPSVDRNRIKQIIRNGENDLYVNSDPHPSELYSEYVFFDKKGYESQVKAFEKLILISEEFPMWEPSLVGARVADSKRQSFYKKYIGNKGYVP